MISPLANVSPFDVNMALDAGFDTVMPYTGVGEGEIKALVQDAMFSRSAKNCRRQGLFICGRDASLALAMMEIAKQTMFEPFRFSVFPDPAGSFTTAAAMVACTEKALRDKFSTDLKGKKVKIYGGKGIVGSISAVICAAAAAESTIIGYDGIENVSKIAAEFKERFKAEIIPADGSSDDKNTALLADADVVFCAARAGTQVLSEAQLATAEGKIKVVADVNAVPPAGIQGVGLHDDCKPLKGGALSIGPLTSGDVKVKTQHALFRKMCQSDDPLFLNFAEATEVARQLVGIA